MRHQQKRQLQEQQLVHKILLPSIGGGTQKHLLHHPPLTWSKIERLSRNEVTFLTN